MRKRLKLYVVMVIASLMLLMVGYGVLQVLLVLQFEKTTGEVLAVRVDHNVSGRINLHTPIVDYQYTVNGKLYRSDVFTRIPLCEDGTIEWADEIASGYTPKTICTVYYNPQDPSAACLNRSLTTRFIWIGIGFMFLGVIHVWGAKYALSELRA